MKPKNLIQKLGPRKAIIVGWSLFTTLILMMALFFVLINRTKTGYIQEYTDKDTGDVVAITPNIEPEKESNLGKNVTLLGLKNFEKFGAASVNTNLAPVFSADIITNALPELGPHDKIVKIVNITYNTQNYLTYADLMVSDDKLYKLIIDVPSAIAFSYTIKSGDKVMYKSDILYDPNFKTSSDDDNFTGDGAPPEELGR